MQKLIIVGAGNVARELLEIVKDINYLKPTWAVEGFIADYGLDVENLTRGKYRTIGNIAQWQPETEDCYICAIADPDGRRNIVEMLEARGARFVNLIHPKAADAINEYSDLGRGNVFYGSAYVGPNAKIGNFNFIASPVAHDCVIGDYVTISGQVGLDGGVSVGDGSFIGTNATIIPRIRIGKHAYIGAGSVVIRNVKDQARVFGNPARVMDF